MAKQPPFCIDCKHHLLPPNIMKPIAGDYICKAVFNVVTGEQLNWKCYNARGDQLVCGRDGKLFEAIENPS